MYIELLKQININCEVKHVSFISSSYTQFPSVILYEACLENVTFLMKDEQDTFSNVIM